MSWQNTQTWFCHYVKVATQNNVLVDWAILTDRVQLTCEKCGLQLTAPKPKDETVDYGVQEFVKLHAHVQQIQTTTFPQAHYQAMQNWGKLQPYAPAAMAGINPLPDTEANGYEIDKGKIQEKLKQYQQEVAAKTDDVMAAKIAALQAEGAEKTAEATKNWLDAEKAAEAQAKAAAMAAENVKKAQALKEKLAYQLLQLQMENEVKKKIAEAEEAAKPKGKWVFIDEDEQMVVKPKKQIGALEEPEGRKFR
jgi:hypothetical protein